MAAPAEIAAVDWFAITPGRGDRDEIVGALDRLAARGVRRLLLREKSMEPGARLRLAADLAARCAARAIELWISEDVAAARETGAAGVHLSERSPSPLEVRASLPATQGIGVSLHEPISRSREELRACAHAFLSPLFPGSSKAPGAAPMGIARFVDLSGGLPLRVYALGGIGEPEAAALRAAGVTRIAGIRHFFAPGARP